MREFPRRSRHFLRVLGTNETAEVEMRALDSLIQEILPSVVELRREIHSDPEMGFEEVRTATRVINVLEKLPGLSIRKNVAKTGLVATLGAEKKGPCVALRADMDCLPIEEATGKSYASKRKGFMHACGHDGHTAALVGAAMVLSRIQTELSGPVKFLFQPAEEGMGGAKVMCDERALEDPHVEAIFGLHGWPNLQVGNVAVRGGTVLAGNTDFEIVIRGRGTHAAFPQFGIDPIVIGSQIVTALQALISRETDPSESAVLTVSMFHAGTAKNVIPETAVLEGTLRYLNEEVSRRLQERLRRVVEVTAAAFGGSASVEFMAGYPVLVNDDRVSKFTVGLARELLGADRTHTEFPPVMGVEDFAFFGRHVPSTYWLLGLCPKGQDSSPALHHPEFDFNEEALPFAIEMHCELARRFATEGIAALR